MPRKKTDEDREFDIRVGARIEAARRKRKMTQRTLAVRIGVTQQQLYWYEAGKNSCPLRTLLIIATEIGVSAGELYKL